MTADLDTNEFITFSGQPRALDLSTHRRTPPVFHQYGRVSIADGAAAQPDSAASPTMGETGAAGDLTLTERLGEQAFRQRCEGPESKAKRDRPYQGLPWDGAAAEGGPVPIHPAGSAIVSPGPDRPALAPSPNDAAPLSARLTGRVALGLVIVSGTAAHLRFSEADQTLVVAEVQNGLSFLASEAPNRDVTFVHDISVLTVDAAEADPASRDFDAFEAPWRDQALAQLGHGPGLAGADAYARALRDRHGTDWAYIAFFTKYRLGHFAYATLGGPRLVMHFDNDGWGPQQIDRVFAHETGHIFYAPDEYAQSGCDCGGAWGHFREPNRNCAGCAPGGGVKCIMQSNDWAMCDATRRHLGYSGLPDISDRLLS